MTLYLIVASLLFFVLAIIWSRKNFPNLVLKVLFAALAAYGAFLVAEQLGYIVKA